MQSVRSGWGTATFDFDWRRIDRKCLFQCLRIGRQFAVERRIRYRLTRLSRRRHRAAGARHRSARRLRPPGCPPVQPAVGRCSRRRERGTRWQRRRDPAGVRARAPRAHRLQWKSTAGVAPARPDRSLRRQREQLRLLLHARGWPRQPRPHRHRAHQPGARGGQHHRPPRGRAIRRGIRDHLSRLQRYLELLADAGMQLYPGRYPLHLDEQLFGPPARRQPLRGRRGHVDQRAVGERRRCALRAFRPRGPERIQCGGRGRRRRQLELAAAGRYQPGQFHDLGRRLSRLYQRRHQRRFRRAPP